MQCSTIVKKGQRKRYRFGSVTSFPGVVQKGLLQVADLSPRELHSFNFVSYVAMDAVLSVGILPASNFMEVGKLIETHKFIRLTGLLIRFFGFKHVWHVELGGPDQPSKTVQVGKNHAFLSADRKLIRVKALKPGDQLIGEVAGRLFEVRSIRKGEYVPVAEVATSSPNAYYSVDGVVSGNMITHRKHMTIASYGIMIFRVQEGKVEILLVQNRHSWAWLDLLRGKYYNQGPLTDIVRIFLSEITEEEREMLRTMSFKDLWKEMDWPTPKDDAESPATAQFLKAEAKFRELDIPALLNDLPPSKHGPIVGPPKGRMSGHSETPLDSARRETLEETGLKETDYEVLPLEPITETQVATNGVRYKNQFFLAELKTEGLDAVVEQSDREISKSIWVTKESAVELLRNYEDAKKAAILDGFEKFETYLLLTKP